MELQVRKPGSPSSPSRSGRDSPVTGLQGPRRELRTPAGSYSVFRKEVRSWSVPFKVWLPWASYFVGGIAFHEYPDVPVAPASHGCVRTPRYDARWLYEFTPIGTPVRVLARS